MRNASMNFHNVTTVLIEKLNISHVRGTTLIIRDGDGQEFEITCFAKGSDIKFLNVTPEVGEHSWRARERAEKEADKAIMGQAG
jgi:hypothetical protein|tara:strand:+ start:186 stop:437 length:252 start_codon:yes stop_codon:yes gene_type:complete